MSRITYRYPGEKERMQNSQGQFFRDTRKGTCDQALPWRVPQQTGDLPRTDRLRVPASPNAIQSRMLQKITSGWLAREDLGEGLAFALALKSRQDVVT